MVLPFGIKAIDEHLPEGGLALGALHEVAGGGNGVVDGAASALFAAGIAARTGGRGLWCVTRQDSRPEFPGNPSRERAADPGINTGLGALISLREPLRVNNAGPGKGPCCPWC